MSAIKEYYAKNHTRNDRTNIVRNPLVKCRDGFKVSIQASAYHYCSPRYYVASGDYSSWELGFPNAADDLIQGYAETPEDQTQTVYGYVPTHVVDALIEKHGGIVE